MELVKKEVAARGGLAKVDQCREWRQIARAMVCIMLLLYTICIRDTRALTHTNAQTHKNLDTRANTNTTTHTHTYTVVGAEFNGGAA